MAGYQKQTWADNSPVFPVSAARMNVIEQAIFDLKTLTFNVRDYGAVGDGVTDDTAAIEAAWTDAQAANPDGVLYIPQGNFVYNGTGLTTAGNTNAVIIGQSRATSKITLGSTSSLLHITQLAPRMEVRGLWIQNGADVISSVYTGADTTNDIRIIEDNYFNGYTGCCIQNNASDSAWWKIKDNKFRGGSFATAIGIAIGGLADESAIKDNDFDASHRICVKVTHGGPNVYIENNGFVFGSGTPANTRVKLWIVPQPGSSTNSNGLVVRGNKFGNENAVSGDYWILIADGATAENGTTALRGNIYPTLAASTGFLLNSTFESNMWGNAGTGGSPAIPAPIYSFTPNLRDLMITQNSMSGTAFNYLAQIDGSVTVGADRFNQTNLVVNNTAETAGVTVVGPDVSNQPSMFRVIDPTEKLHTKTTGILPYPSGNSSTLFNNLYTAAANSYSLVTGATLVTSALSPVVDSLGGSDAAEYSVTSSTSSLVFKNLATPTIAAPTWVEFEVKQGTSSPLSQIQAVMRYGGSTQHWSRIVDVGTAWTRYRFLWYPREATSTIQFQFVSLGVAGQFQIGRVNIYQAREPMMAGGMKLKAANGSVYTVNVDNNGNLTGVNNPNIISLAQYAKPDGVKCLQGATAIGTSRNRLVVSDANFTTADIGKMIAINSVSNVASSGTGSSASTGTVSITNGSAIIDRGVGNRWGYCDVGRTIQILNGAGGGTLTATIVSLDYSKQHLATISAPITGATNASRTFYTFNWQRARIASIIDAQTITMDTPINGGVDGGTVIGANLQSDLSNLEVHYGTDNYTGFQSFLTACSTAGLPGYVPPGVWLSSAGFMLASVRQANGLTLVGAGQGRSVLRGLTLDSEVAQGGGFRWAGTSDVAPAQHVYLSDFTINVPTAHTRSPTSTTPTGVFLESVQFFAVRRVTVDNCYNVGMTFQCCSDGVISDCSVSNSWADGFNINNNNVTNTVFHSDRISVIGCRVFNSGDDMFAINYRAGNAYRLFRHITFADCEGYNHRQACLGRGICWTGVENSTVDNVNCYNMTGPGVIIGASVPTNNAAIANTTSGSSSVTFSSNPTTGGNAAISTSTQVQIMDPAGNGNYWVADVTSAPAWVNSSTTFTLVGNTNYLQPSTGLAMPATAPFTGTNLMMNWGTNNDGTRFGLGGAVRKSVISNCTFDTTDQGPSTSWDGSGNAVSVSSAAILMRAFNSNLNIEDLKLDNIIVRNAYQMGFATLSGSNVLDTSSNDTTPDKLITNLQVTNLTIDTTGLDAAAPNPRPQTSGVYFYPGMLLRAGSNFSFVNLTIKNTAVQAVWTGTGPTTGGVGYKGKLTINGGEFIDIGRFGTTGAPIGQAVYITSSTSSVIRPRLTGLRITNPSGTTGGTKYVVSKFVEALNASALGGMIADLSHDLFSYTCTISNASPGVITVAAGHSLVSSQPVVFTTTGTLPTGLSPNVTYYVIAAGLTSTAFEVSATVGGSAINTSSAGSGTHTVTGFTTSSISNNFTTPPGFFAKSGAFSDADFTIANTLTGAISDGLVGIDTSGNALNFRSSGAWYAISGTTSTISSIAAWVNIPNSTGSTVTIGTLPANVFVHGVGIWIDSGSVFNGTGTNTLNVGFNGGSATALALAIDASSGGLKNPVYGTSVGYNSSSQTVQAYYNGTSPTTGKALIVVEFYTVPVKL